jgi:hypothetical protein
MATAVGPGVGAVPGEPLLQLPELDEGLLRDGERLHQDGHVAEARRHHVHVAGVVHHELGHETVRFLDAALPDVARGA